MTIRNWATFCGSYLEESTNILGTIHLRRRQIFYTFLTLTPLPSAVFCTIRRQIWQLFDPSPLEHADVLNGWSLSRISNSRLIVIGKKITYE